MNIGLITSYIIAGMILIAILTMNLNMSASSNELALTETTREHVKNISELITYDIPKIGYNKTEKTPTLIVKADSTEIIFKSNIDDSGDKSIETVTWKLTNTPVTATDNPNDYVLQRIVTSSGGSSETTNIGNGVTRFRLKYYDKYGAPQASDMVTPVDAASLSSIRQIDVEVMVQSEQKLTKNTSSDGAFIKSVWEKRFSPPNLQN